ncbi:MAG: AAA family ATPase [Deltaproteobacteria bacterium]|nr:AAA family ATPase [Deltaproteobacteria bacterium]MBW2480566.1 AAA family ATPase [Deltaproteobacteria bacterium]
MTQEISNRQIPIKDLRWRLDPSTLPFDTTETLQPLKEIIGQKRGVEAFRFGIDMDKPGYNVFVTGAAGSGRMATVKRLLEEMSKKDGTPEDLCYVNCFKNPESPVLIRLPGGTGSIFKRDVKNLVDRLKKEIPQLFESQEYMNMKKEITDTYENQAGSFFKNLEKKVNAEGFAIVDVQMGQFKRPEVMPVVDGKPVPIEQLEAMVEKGRFPKDEYESLKEKQGTLRKEIEQIFIELRELQKEIHENIETMDRAIFMKTAGDRVRPLAEKYGTSKIQAYFQGMLEDMADNLKIFSPQTPLQIPGLPPVMTAEVDLFQPYDVNLLVDNQGRTSPPVIIEDYPTYRNIFGAIERVVDRSGVWRTDYSKIKAGSLVKANGGFLVINLRDAIIEPGVWQAMKRALKSKKIEIQTFDPMYFFTTTGLKPEPIELKVKVVIIGDTYLYQLLDYYDDDLKKIFKVRADFDTAMNRDDQSILQFAEFIKMVCVEEKLRPFDRTAVAALIEQAVRMAGRQEKISTSFPAITDLIREADFYAGRDQKEVAAEAHVDSAIQARIFRSNLTEERIQEMIDRGTLMIDVKGEVVGQVNGLAVYSLGDYMFGKPARITASTSMGRAGLINIEREADMSGNTHNKGVLILGGYLRKKYAQNKPLTMSASIAFEQSYSGVDGDSASSTEIYALLSALSGVPIKQNIAVTGSVNQKGEVQAIGGVNHKIEGFYDCCRHKGLTGEQGVMIPRSNVKDLMLRKDVVAAVEEGRFTIYAVTNIDEGIEILTGRPAGGLKPDGSYSEGSINFRVDQKLQELAEGIKDFAGGQEAPNRPGKCQSC